MLRHHSHGRMLISVVAILAPLQLLIAGVMLWRTSAPGLFGGDFIAYATAAHLVAGGGFGHLYDLAAQQQFQHTVPGFAGLAAGGLTAVPFDYPPPAALLFLPLAVLPLRAGLFLWTVLNAVLAVAALLRVCQDAVPSGLRRPQARLLVAGLACAFLPLDWGLLAGQPVGIVLLLGALAYLALRRGRDVQAGVALALLAAVKPQLALAPILGLVALRRWRAVAAVTAAGAALLLLSLLLAGPSGIGAYLHLLRQMDDFGGNPALAVRPEIMPNWRAWVARWPGIDGATGLTLSTILDALTLLLALALCARRPRRATLAWTYLALMAAGIVGSYHSHYQDLVLLLPPLLTLLAGIESVPVVAGVRPRRLAPTLAEVVPRRLTLAVAAGLVALPSLAWLSFGVLALGRLELWVTLAGPGLLLTLLAVAARELGGEAPDAALAGAVPHGGLIPHAAAAE